MPKVTNAFRATTTDVLTAVSATTNVVAKTAQTASNYMDYLEVHSERVSQTARIELAVDLESIHITARENAKRRLVHHRLELEHDLKDPDFARIYDSIKFDDELQKPRSVA